MKTTENNSQAHPACMECQYFHAHTNATGDCYRYPPVFAGSDTPNERHRWKHPLVVHNGWCGEFPARSA